jgi:hypothetical protein
MALASFVIATLMQTGGQAGSSVLTTVFESARAAGADWIALALLLSLVSVILSMRLAGRNA